MEHLVKFHSAEGREGQHTAASLDDALRFVERLRNNEDASDVRVFRMNEIPIEFKTYYKVEVRPGDEPRAEGEAAPAEAPENGRSSVSVARAGHDGESDASARRLFSRS